MPGPNFKEDPDRTTSPTVKLTKTERQRLIDYLKARALYIEPGGRMHFEEGYTADTKGYMYYPGGGFADGIPPRGFSDPINSSIRNRYTIDPPLPVAIGNRYTVPTPSIGQRVIDADNKIRQEFEELFRLAGFIK